ncbi:MAG: hypothetical protein OXL41_15525 [Nitrospinae bacterium]|nr:hypothetical protein [Nitrospinota bacterium]
MEIEVTKAVGPHFRDELEAAGLAHLYLGSAHRLAPTMIPDADWRPRRGEAESARPEIHGSGLDAWVIHLADSSSEAQRDAILAAHAAHAPDGVAQIHRDQTKEKLNLLLNDAKARIVGVPVSALGGKLAEYEEKTKLIDAWAQDSHEDKLAKPAYLLIRNRKDAYPARYATGQSVVDEWASRRATLLGKLASLLKIYDECVRDTQDADITASVASLDSRLEEAASAFDGVR